MLRAEKGAAEKTVQAYMSDLYKAACFCTATPHQTPLHQASTSLLQRYLMQQRSDGRKASTLARQQSALKQFFVFLLSEKQRKDNPMLPISAPKKATILPKVLTVDQTESLLKAAHSKQDAKGLRLAAMVEILYASGLRVSELIALKKSSLQQVQMEPGTPPMQVLKVHGKGNKERIVPLHAHATNTLARYLEIRDQFTPTHLENDYLFPTPNNAKKSHITRQRVGQLLRALACEAGITQNVSPHMLRHCFATHLLHKGMELRFVQTLLGHADISTTQIYTHIHTPELEQAIAHAHPLSQQSKKERP